MMSINIGVLTRFCSIVGRVHVHSGRGPVHEQLLHGRSSRDRLAARETGIPPCGLAQRHLRRCPEPALNVQNDVGRLCL